MRREGSRARGVLGRCEVDENVKCAHVDVTLTAISTRGCVMDRYLSFANIGNDKSQT